MRLNMKYQVCSGMTAVLGGIGNSVAWASGKGSKRRWGLALGLKDKQNVKKGGKNLN